MWIVLRGARVPFPEARENNFFVNKTFIVAFENQITW